VNGFLVFVAIVTVTRLTLWLIASIAITAIDSKRAARIISAMVHVPAWWWRL
jgi:hypothetical protein